MSQRSLSIRYRVLALTLLPMTLLALVLGSYFTVTRVADNRTNLLERGSSLARMMASAAEFGVLSGNTELLQSLTSGPVRHDEVADILFYDQNFRLLYRSGRFDVRVNRSQALPQLERGIWYFVEPIKINANPMVDNPELAPLFQRSETVGWVAVLISAEPTIKRENQILLRSIGLTLAGLVIALALGNRFGRRITKPIIGLTRLIERLQRGELSARADVIQTGELRTLASGINRLAARVQESNQQFEYRVESATRRLTRTLRHLEKRNQELQLERQRADDANRAKDEFLARMSHELRTPLTSVIGFAHLLAQSRLDPEQQEYVHIVNRTSELLLTIIDDILDFSRLESNAIVLETIEFDPQQCLFDVIDAQAPRAFRKGLELIADIAPDLPSAIEGDPTRLSQVLNNLIGNAIKFTEEGEVVITAEVRQGAEEAQLYIRISDTGIGIPESRIGQLFTAFSQADSSISRRFGGSGLGLVIAHHLTELMGGHIALSSRESEGTEVSIELPLRQVSAPQQSTQAPEQSATELLLFEPSNSSRQALIHQLSPYVPNIRVLQRLEEVALLPPAAAPRLLLVAFGPHDCSARAIQAVQARIRTMSNIPMVFLLPDRSHQHLHTDDTRLLPKPVRPIRLLQLLGLDIRAPSHPADTPPTTQLPYPLQILVAEDNDFNRLLIRRLLEGIGAEVSEVTNGRSVLEYLQSATPDLILMDVHMPGMDGIEATRRVRAQLPELPIIALTANVVPHEHQALMNVGITDLLLKPVNVPELMRVLLHLCELKTGQRSTPPPVSNTLRNALRTLAEPAAVHDEVRRLAQLARQATIQRDRKQVRSCAHQLLGIAGLYEKPVLEDCTAEVHKAASSGTMRDLWYAVSRLYRIAEQELLE